MGSRRQLILSALVLGVGCGPSSPKKPTAPTSPTPPLEASPAADAKAALATVDSDSLERIVTFLASDDLAGRRTPSAGLEAAADYIAAGFAELELTVLATAPGYRQTFDCGGRGRSSNVAGLLEGRSRDPLILVSAHYDHLGDRAPGDDKIYNGANDNASGVAAMLMIAQALRRRPDPLDGSVLFVAFCGEEQGLLGSKHFITAPLVPTTEIDAVINLEMLGRPGAGDHPTAWMTGYGYSTLGAQLAAAAGAQGAKLVDARQIGETEGDAFDRSDNYPFATAGIVAHTIAAGRIDDLYHSADDEVDALEFEPMAVIVRGLAAGVADLANTKARLTVWTDAGIAAGFGGQPESRQQ